MKSTMTMNEFISEIERVEKSKRDLYVTSGLMKMTDDAGLKIARRGDFAVRPWAHTQIAERLGIPTKYYEKMRVNEPDLLAENVNRWMSRNDKSRFIRTIDGNVRAFLSDQFKVMDNYELLYGLLPIMKTFGDSIDVIASTMSETRMYLDLRFPTIRTDVKVGDAIAAGVLVTNSEVGNGFLDIYQKVWRLRCTNGAIGESILRKMHLGASITNEAYYKADTVAARNKALRLELRDAFKSAVDQSYIESQAERLRIAAGDAVEKKPMEFVKDITKRFVLSDDEGESILTNMLKEDNMTRYGLYNGITWTAHEVEDPDRQFELEKLSSEIITLSRKDWEVISN